MTGRRVCLTCGASYHIKFNPPKIDGKCDVCGSDVIQRADDTEETVSERLRCIWKHKHNHWLNYYREKNLLISSRWNKSN